MKSNGKSLATYIAPVNHNRINTGLLASIASNMLGCYAQDTDKDAFQLQAMGLGMQGCYLVTMKKCKNFLEQYIHNVSILFINSLANFTLFP